ncbi:T9SS type A sorting domain-containing protein [Winogradskyella sp.]|uniref:T9SS type A sorting domain-containing protein n=1 Tax=Winogradskyella sp. TaxID=1883156 RepID=UPI0026269E49|nr:T9SS type A sorting domain-containing protein [Winogradskyella sp.]
MKHSLLALLLTLSVLMTTQAQTVWAAKSTINSNTGDAPYAIASGLVDADALPDIVIGTYIGNTIEWYKNNGDGTFTIQPLVSNVLDGIGALKLVDLNGDTFLDILATGYNNNRMVWIANDGNGNFVNQNVISNGISGASGIALGNINNDAHLDIAVTAYDNDEVMWFSGNGAGNFTLETTRIDNTLNAPSVINLSDIDGDGDLDALIATTAYDGNDVIEIFRNNLIPSGTVSFTKDTNSVATGKTGIFSASFEDLDGDTNLDILATEVSVGGGPTGSLYWYEDNGSGFTETAFTTAIVNPSVAQFKDLDADGLNDIVLSSGSSGAGDDLVWFKNNGSGSFGSETVIDNTQSQAFVYTINDFDNDGDNDIVSCAYNQNDLNYFENLLESLDIDDFSQQTISVFPNPTSDILNFEVFDATVINIAIFDILGKVVMVKSHDVNQPLDVSTLANGIYSLNINGEFMSKFIKD